MKSVEEIASQKRLHSLLESIVNVIVGLGINIIIQHLVFPLFGIQISWAQNMQIAGIFTVVSIVRSFFLRRAFNQWHVNGHTNGKI